MKDLIYLFPIVLFVNCASFAQTSLVSQGADWKYLDDGSDQGTAWTALGFDDSSWSSGPAQLGYGDGDEATVVSYGSNAADKYVTTYFRHHFNISNPSSIGNLVLNLLRDDGAVVFLNGTEIYRSNMTNGAYDYQTYSENTVDGSEEDQWFTAGVDPNLLISGDNVLAVEIHQRGATSSDISFDFELLANNSTSIVRGPYLQSGTDHSIIVRWRTDIPAKSQVIVGTNLSNLTDTVTETALTTEHEVLVDSLDPNTKYYYRLGDGFNYLTTEGEYYHFITHPTIGTEQLIRAWFLGDCGTGNSNARDVRDAYYNYVGNDHTDMTVMLGDNAYDDGTDSEYQTAVFENMYEEILAKSVLWSCPGNHDMRSANSTDQTGVYYDIFTFPTQGEAGGLASGTEAYYSWDYGNIHFISMDSHDSDRGTNGPMLTWLANDLSATTQEWIVAIWHHPAYTKGSHDSDFEARLIEMRQNALPILEAGGVDLVLNGHSHSYERSYLLNGHYGFSFFLDQSSILDDGSGKYDVDCPYEKVSTSDEGAVYITAGSSGKTSGGLLNHPVMYVSLDELGSCVMEVEENRLDLKFVRENGNVDDYFSIVKDAGVNQNVSVPSGQSVTLSASWPGEYLWAPAGGTDREITITPTTDGIYTVNDPYGCFTDTFNVTVTPVGLSENIKQFKLYPNPTKGELVLEFTNNQAGKVNIDVSDIQGEIIHQETRQLNNGEVKFAIQLPELSDGNYLLHLAGDGIDVKQRFQLQK